MRTAKVKWMTLKELKEIAKQMSTTDERYLGKFDKALDAAILCAMAYGIKVYPDVERLEAIHRRYG